MKRLLLFTGVLMIVASSALAAPIIIKGHCAPQHRDSLCLQTYRSIADFIDYNTKKMRVAIVKPDANGFFSISYDINEGHYFTLVSADGTSALNGAFLLPGDSLFVEIGDTSIGAQKFPMNHIYGTGARTAQYQEQFSRNNFYMYMNKRNLSTDSFSKLIDSLNSANLQLLEKCDKDNNWPRTLLEQLKINSSYNWKNEKLVYIWPHNSQGQKKGDVKVNPQYFSFITQDDLHNERALNDFNYYRFLDEYPQELAREKWLHLSDNQRERLKSIKEKFEMESRAHIIDSLFSGKFKEIAFSKFVSNLISYLNYGDATAKANRIWMVDSLLEKIKPKENEMDGSLYARLLAKRLKAVSLENAQAPLFTLPDSNGNVVALADFKGKVVLLDFWEPGCVPCMLAIPSSNKLQEELAGKDFVMLGVCIKLPKEATKQIWRWVFNKYHWKGIHLMETNDSKMREAYLFDGYPHYVLIDKKGIIRNSNAGSNDESLKKQIEELLKE